MADFVGRQAELALLRKRLDRVAQAGQGIAVTIRGRRQIGKSRLVQEFCDVAAVPYFFFTAVKGESMVESVAAFAAELRQSPVVAEPEAVPAAGAASWTDAFRLLAAAIRDVPSIAVLDEVPWLAEQDRRFDGQLQAAWDRLLAARPILLLLLGSDLHMMERLTAYDRPFFGRADNLVLGPLNPNETGKALDLAAPEAIDAHLITGGLPGIIRSWPRKMPPLEFLRQECRDPAAPVFSVPESALLAEFPSPDQSRRVLEAIGSGERTHEKIAAAVGGPVSPLPSGSLSPVLARLVREKQIVSADQPLSSRPSRPALYRVTDSNLRWYLAAGRAAHELARRGRADVAFRLVHRRWSSWRGKAVEPLVRQSLALACAAGTTPWPDAEVIGGWWTRRFQPHVDLVGADRVPVASRIYFVGSVKWLGSPADRHDLAELARSAALVPGFSQGETGLAMVSLGGTAPEIGAAELDLSWGPEDVLDAWLG